MPKQEELPGTERPKIQAIETAAEAYVDVRDKRMKLTEKEVELKQKLIDTVGKNADKLSEDGEGNRIYRYDDMVVILKPGHPNVKVKHAADPDEGED